MHVVVAAAYGGFSVEGNHHIIAGKSAQVNALMLVGIGDFVIHIFRAIVVPLAQDFPVRTIVGRNQHDELVVGLVAGGRTGVAVGSINGECKVEGEFHVVFHCQGGQDQPFVARGAPNVNSSMAVGKAVVGAEAPCVSVDGQRCCAV